MIEQIEIDAVIRNEEMYPRSSIDSATVEQYRQAIDKLPPIKINKNMLLIDGAHRIEAHRREGIAFIKADILDIPDEEVFREAVKLNVAHGKQLTQSEKKSVGLKLYDEETDNRKELVDLLSLDESTINRWTENIRGERAKRLKQEQNEKILEMWFKNEPQQAIADAIGITQQAVSERITSLTQLREACKDIKQFNLWQFQAPDPAFGIDYPGRIPGQILVNLLHYYTDIGDLVYDPFGGGGVTIDVCRYMMRRYKVFDIEPRREDIEKWDVVKDGLAVTNAKLMFLDPPYWAQKKGVYPHGETNLANMDLDIFNEELEKIVKSGLDAEMIVALIIGATQHEQDFVDHAGEMIRRIGLPHQRIIVPYTTQQYGGAHVNQSKDGRFMLNIYRDLMIWLS